MEKPFFIHQNINDFDQFCASVVNWDLDYRQLDAGGFSSELLVCGTDKLQFTHARLGRKMLQKGISPQGLFTFGVLADPSIRIYWRNIEISADMIFVFPEGGELCGTTFSDFNVYVVSLHEDRINHYCALLGLPDIRQLIGGNEAFECNGQKMAALRRWFRQTKNDLIYTELNERDMPCLIEFESVMIPKLLSILSDHNQSVCQNLHRKRDRALLAAETCLQSAGNGFVTVAELCHEANVSERTLQYAFQERFGMTAKSYSMAMRLNEVRKQLKDSNPGKHSVADVARQNGFWHMSKFGVDYKRMFNELPSKTLKA